MSRPSSQSLLARAKAAAPAWDYLLVACLALAFFAVVATLRIVDDDEGFYALAGRAWVGGQVPYRDFFFPQMPLGAALYGAYQVVFGSRLASLRFLAALLAATTTLVVQHGARRTAGRAAGLFAAALFATHTLVWEWAPTVKTFPLGLLLGTAALVVATSPVVTRGRALLAGVLAGAAVAARALSLPVVFAVLFALLQRRTDKPDSRTNAGLAAIGAGVGLAPAIVVAALDPRAFFFDNVTYHALRSPGVGLVKDHWQKLDAARAVFLAPLGAHRPDVTGLQTTGLFVGAALGVAAWKRARSSALLPFFVAAVLVVAVSFLPSPVWVQYVAAAIAPASIVAGCWMASLERGRLVGATLVLAYAASAIPSFFDRLVAEPGVLRPSSLDRVGAELDRVTQDGDAVAAHWPSYLVASRRAVLPSARNQFARLYSDQVPEADRRRFHLFTEAEFREALVRGDARAFVVGSFVVPETALALMAAGWTRASSLPGATIWVAPGGTNPSMHPSGSSRN